MFSNEVFIPGNVCSEALFKGKSSFFSLKIVSLTSREIGYTMEKCPWKGTNRGGYFHTAFTLIHREI